MDLTQLSIGERVGRGGMGTVHRALWKSPTGGVPVAVKFLAGSRKIDVGAMFLREARAAARLSHPNVVTLLDAGRVADPNSPSSPGIPYLVMEWVEGDTLAAKPPSSWEVMVSVLRQLLDALAHAHGWGVLHRDLKPANVMCTQDGTARLMDFGVGRVLDDPLSEARGEKRRIIGTPKFMAPEQVLAEWRDEGPWTDIYGLGALTWELVTGKPLFDGDAAKILVAQARHRPPQFHAAFQVPYGLRNWLYTALEKRPRDRFQSAAEARAALDDLDDGERTSRYPVVTPGKAAANVATHLVVPQRHANDDRPVSSELRAAGAGLFGMREPPLVGRELQKEQLWNAFRRVSRLERSEIVFVRGERGTGKTALAGWLARRAIEGGFAAVLRSNHTHGVAGEAALLGAVTRELRLEGLDADAALERAARGLGALGFADSRTLALDLVARCFPGTSERQGLQDADDWHRFLLEFARRVGESAPTVWIVDDAHLSESSTAFLRVAAKAEFGLLVVATTTTLERDPEIRRAFDVEVGPLSDGAMRELVQAMLPLEPKLIDTLTTRAQGSPMFATELLGDWVSRDVLVPGPLGYRAPDDAVSELPDDIHDVWRGRIATLVAALGEAAHDALRLLAVLGDEVAVEEWRHGCALLEMPDPGPLLEALMPFGLVRADRQHMRLTHALLRESILRDGELARFHLAAADAVAAFGSTPKATERVARHLWAAGCHRDGLERLERAIRGYEDAGELDAVILLVPMLRSWANEIGLKDSLLVASGLVSLNAMLRFRGGVEAGRPALEDAASIVFAGHSLDDMLQSTDPVRARLATRVLTGRGVVALATSPSRALNQFRDAYRVASRHGLVADALTSATFESDCLRELGRVDDAYDVLEAALTNLGKGPLTPRVAIAANERIADMCELRGDFDGALAAMERALGHAESIGDYGSLAFATSRMADFESYAGRLDEARAWGLKSAQMYEERGSWAAKVLRASVVMFDVLAGRIAESRAAATQIRTEFQEEPFRRFVAPATLLCATCEAHAGDHERAAALFELAQDAARVRVIRETAMLAVALAENATGQLAADAAAFARLHAAQLPPVYLARLDVIT